MLGMRFFKGVYVFLVVTSVILARKLDCFKASGALSIPSGSIKIN